MFMTSHESPIRLISVCTLDTCSDMIQSLRFVFLKHSPISGFFITGHHGRSVVGSGLKAILDSVDVLMHLFLAGTHPHHVIHFSHATLLGWYCAKAADSHIISSYSPLRGLLLPNIVDTSAHTMSGVLGAFSYPLWAAAAAASYGFLRFGLDVIYLSSCAVQLSRETPSYS